MATKNIFIDLRSDTITRPTPPMLNAMMEAQVGDDVFGDDPAVNALEEKAAGLFGMDAALFCPSGTMTNQIAIRAHTSPGDEVICERGAHVYNYEGGGIASNSGASVRLIDGDRGRITAEQVYKNINPDNVHYPVTRLVVAENTANRGGGSCYDFKQLDAIGNVCMENGLSFHLDGARLFNAMVYQKENPKQYGALFDSISVCLSKGLGAPVGSLLMGTTDFIRHARRIRKVFGGGMRQAGYLAAAGIYALDHHVDRLAEDHRRAKQLETTLLDLPWVSDITPVETNILVIKVKPEFNAEHLLERLGEKGLLAIGFGHQTIRMVTHLNFSDEMLEQAVDILLKTQ